MFKVPAASVEEYFRFDLAREDALRELDAVIRAAAPANIGDISLHALAEMVGAIAAGLDSGQLAAR